MLTNAEVARRFIMAIPHGDADAVRAAMSPDAVVGLRIAGVYSPELQAFRDGIQWNREEWIARCQDRAKAMKEPADFRILSMVSEGDRVAAEVIAQGVRAATGKQYIQHYSYQVQIWHEEVVDVRLYQDTLHEWDVWQNPGISIAAFKPPMLAKKTTPVTLRQVVTPEEVNANRAAIRRWINAIPGRDADTIRAELAPDMVWSFAMGGDYVPELRSFPGALSLDRDGMVELQVGFQDHLLEPYTFDLYSMIADGDQVAAELVGIHVSDKGIAYRQHYSIHFKLRDHKMVEGHVYQDTLHQFDSILPRDRYAPVASPIHPKR